MVGGGTPIRGPDPSSSSTSCELISRGYTKIYFGENQLSPSLIGLSPLPSSHPSGFQPTWVRSSTACYGGFNLLKGRSPRLRVYPHVRCALFRLAFATAPALRALTMHVRSNSPDHNAKGTPSDRPKTILRPLVSTRFQDLFHSPPGVLFTFPSRY